MPLEAGVPRENHTERAQLTGGFKTSCCDTKICSLHILIGIKTFFHIVSRLVHAHLMCCHEPAIIC